MEKALIDEYSKTISRKTDKEKKIQDIKCSFKNNEYV